MSLRIFKRRFLFRIVTNFAALISPLLVYFLFSLINDPSFDFKQPYVLLFILFCCPSYMFFVAHPFYFCILFIDPPLFSVPTFVLISVFRVQKSLSVLVIACFSFFITDSISTVSHMFFICLVFFGRISFADISSVSLNMVQFIFVNNTVYLYIILQIVRYRLGVVLLVSFCSFTQI